MTNKTLEDFGRRDLNFWNDKVIEVLPEFFRSEYPQLIELLDAYYDYMDSDGSINDELCQVLRTKDINGVSIRFLDFLLKETGGGLNADDFSDPRTVARFMPDFFRYKGSAFSAKAFFRILYDEDVTITYPKDNLFIVGQSEIGPESLKIIQDGALYQVLSVLITSSKSINEWRNLYKSFVHSAGFYLGGQVLIEECVDLSLDSMPSAIDDPNANILTVSEEAAMAISVPFDPLTADVSSPNTDSDFIIDLERDVSSIYDDSALKVDTFYEDVFDYAKADALGFEDSSGVRWSARTETFDRGVFGIKDVDSVSPPPVINDSGDFALLEDSDSLLLEDSDNLILESETIFGLTEDSDTLLHEDSSEFLL